eukprot:Phypoly_transcript_02407.p1 GENE.Phypoly_transcript_02407~~Phypoly_transcript_02407.p1  ORF type:complete len:908 (+),score=192.75 Phypoly_transcript_02407:68-2791(+)
MNAAFKYITSSGGIREYKLLANGLRVLLLEDHSAPVATFMVTYHVGSRNEAVGFTGATHILEHLMFKGSKEFNKENGKGIWSVLQTVGAKINATTWLDRTNYFELLPSEFLDQAMQIEADRMRNAFLNEEDRQKEMTVVRNEYERGENNPQSALEKLIWATAYVAHPYHHPTIGWRSDIENVSNARLREFYNTFYYPNNATATIIGSFRTEEVLNMVNSRFGAISKSENEMPVMYTEEPEQEGERRVTLRRTGKNGIVCVAYKTPRGVHPDSYPLRILNGVLVSGKNSRLYKALVDKAMATRVEVSASRFHDNGMFQVYAFLTPGTAHAEVEKIIIAEIEKLKNELVSESELSAKKAQIRTSLAFSRDGSYSVASSLNEALAIGDWKFYTTMPERMQAVTAEDVRRVARTYLDADKSTIGYFIPKEEGAKDQKPKAVEEPKVGTEKLEKEGEIEQILEGLSVQPSVPLGGLATRIIDTTPLEGLRLLVLPTQVKDVVTLRGSTLGGDYYSLPANPLTAHVMARMLDQGTQKRTKFEITAALEAVGASLRFSSSAFRISFSGSCLKDDVDTLIELLSEQLRIPAFNEEDFQTIQKLIIGELEKSKEDPGRAARTAFAQATYPPSHPSYLFSPDEEIEAVRKLTRADLRAYHDSLIGLGSLNLVLVGDLAGEGVTKVTESVKKHLGGWRVIKKEIPTDYPRGTLKSNAPINYITMKDKTSCSVQFGQYVGIDRDNEFYYPLYIAMYILGGNFSARLMATVRDQLGLTYGINASLGGMEDKRDGTWGISGTFAPALLQKGIDETIKQLESFAEKGITEEELATKKSTISGTYKVNLATTGGLATAILDNAERGYKMEFLDNYPNMINNIPFTKVNEAIKKFAKRENLLICVAGSVDSEGKPLPSSKTPTA